MLFDIAMIAILSVIVTSFGYDVYKTSNQSNVYAYCDDVKFYSSDKNKYLSSKHYVHYFNPPNSVDENFVLTISLCPYTDKCITKTEKIKVPPYTQLYSDPWQLFAKINNNIPGRYTYRVSTDLKNKEYLKSYHDEKTCHFTIVK